MDDWWEKTEPETLTAEDFRSKLSRAAEELFRITEAENELRLNGWDTYLIRGQKGYYLLWAESQEDADAVQRDEDLRRGEGESR